MKSALRLFAALAAATLLAACSAQSPGLPRAETEEAAFQRGRDLVRTGRPQEALTAFLDVIDQRRGQAPESHFEAGEIYLQAIRDPVAAIYHYRRFIEQKPTSQQTDLVRQRIETAVREFARSLPAQPLETQVERLDLLDRIARLERENTDLKRQLDERFAPVVPVDSPATTRTPPPAAARVPPSAATPPAAATQRPATGPRRHIVRPGDTLYRIAQEMYGNSRRWQDIYEANRNVLPNQSSLRVGMELVIPE